MSQNLRLDVRFAICKFSSMSNVASLIDSLGGYAKIAEAIEVRPGTVAAWRHRGSVPVPYWPKLISAAPALGAAALTYDVLVEAHAGPSALMASAVSGPSLDDSEGQERAKPLRCHSTHGSPEFVTEGQSR
jgi:hypothetical protein